MSHELTGKVAIITGASKGIGASVALHLAKEGASVIVNYSSSKAGADQVVNEIKRVGGKAVALQADVTKEADIRRLISEAVKAFGKIDILVNNAGVYEFAPLENVTAEHFYKMFNLNVLALLLVSQEAAKHFSPSGGSIVNISSVASISTLPNTSVYSATKAAVDAITKSLSKELGARNIRVNSINPGVVETEGTVSAGIMESDLRKHIESQTPLGRVGQPQDIASVVAFFASDDAAWITGESLVVSGGFR